MIGLDFRGKKVLVTGSTKGIGRGVAEAFHDAGAVVAINGRKAEAVQAAIAEMDGGERLVAAPGDLATVAGCRKVVEGAVSAMGGLDVLVNNAGHCPLARLDEVSEEHYREVVDLNLRAVYFCTKFALPALRRSKGNVIHVSSVLGLIAGPPENLVYCITKGALVNMTRAMALELAPDGVRVNCLCPGYIDTPLIAHENATTGGALYRQIEEWTPLARIGTVEECASSVLYFASADAGFVTGAILANDGGCAAQASAGR